MFLKSLQILVFVLLYASLIYAQPFAISDLKIGENEEEWYAKNTNESIDLVAGKLQLLKKASSTTHANYKSAFWSIGNLHYRNQLFDSVHLMYDIAEDVLLLRHPTNIHLFNQPILLNQDQVSSFEIDQDHFLYIKGDSKMNGFVHELFMGDSLQLVSKYKKIQSTNSNDGFVAYNQKKFRHLGYSGNYHTLKSKKDLFILFPNHKKTLQAFVKQRKLKLKADSDEEWILLTEYCQQLLSQE